MPTPRKSRRFGGDAAHQRLMMANLAASLFAAEAIVTTEAKAKALRPLAEHLITFAKRGDVHARRQVLKRVPDRDVVHKLFAEIGPRYSERAGGYTRILKLGQRGGDGSPMAMIELIHEEE
jgi:large subunit ribosomal protein L17